MKVALALPVDAEGFLSQECPACERLFKVQFGQGSSQPLSFCPYCRHHGENCWWTQDQGDYFTAAAREKVISPLVDDFARNMQRLNRPGSTLRVSVSQRPAPRAVAPEGSDESMQVQLFPCCGERIKHGETQGRLFCVICGSETVVV